MPVTPNGKERIEIQVEPDVKQGSELAARRSGLSLSAWIRQLMIRRLDEDFSDTWRTGEEN